VSSSRSATGPTARDTEAKARDNSAGRFRVGMVIDSIGPASKADCRSEGLGSALIPPQVNGNGGTEATPKFVLSVSL
jgi:hypothetical protein